jgi:DNA-binding transcriptional MocR family regulator
MDWLELLKPIAKHKDRRSPMYLRITECIRSAIEDGRLAEEQRLPPDRELAKLLQIDRSTVARAYDQLATDGLVYSHVGRGTFVHRSPSRPAPQSRAVQGGYDRIVWADKFSRSSTTVDAIVQRQPPLNLQPETISFAAGLPTEEFFPVKEFESIVQEMLASSKAREIFSSSQPEGHPALRAQVLAYLKQQGIDASDDEILIVSGSQQGIDLVARTLIDPDDTVLTEDPTYFWAICTFAANGGRCVPIATGRDGMRLDVFENVASRVNAKLLYCMPSFQNPTGSTLSVERRQKLLQMARQHQVPILEDNFVGDLCYTQPVPSLRSLDGSAGSVIYQGTFSKALCPGLRLGWLVAAPDVMARLRLVKRTCDLSTNTLSQLILAEYLQRGLYQEHLELVQNAYRRRLDVMCQALQEHASQWLSFDRPHGGMFIWAKLPPGYSARELLSFAQREGVIYSPGDVFFISGGNSEYMRLNFIQQNAEQIGEGIKRLGKALHAYSNSRKRVVHPGAYVVAESTFI